MMTTTPEARVEHLKEIGQAIVATLRVSLAARFDCPAAEVGITLIATTPASDGDGEHVQTFTTEAPEAFVALILACANRATSTLRESSNQH